MSTFLIYSDAFSVNDLIFDKYNALLHAYTSWCISHWSTCYQSIGSQDATQWWLYSYLSLAIPLRLTLGFLILTLKYVFSWFSHIFFCFPCSRSLDFTLANASITLLWLRIKIPFKNCLPLLLLISPLSLSLEPTPFRLLSHQLTLYQGHQLLSYCLNSSL